MSEYLLQAGRRSELREELFSLSIAVGSHRESLRLALDPIAEATALDEIKIMTLAATLAQRISEAKEVAAKIKAIDEIIGK